MNKKGISLIVLSITILVMAILAATAIIALEDSGIIGRSKNTTAKQNYNEEYTRLQVIKNGILTDNLGEITVDEYITELSNKGLIESGITTNADGSKTVTTKTGFTLNIKQDGESNLILSLGTSNATIALNPTSLSGDITSGPVNKTITVTTSNVTGDITWTTSNANVATVAGTNSSATVTLKGTGNATITATYGAAKASCNVIVTGTVATPTITLNKTTIYKTIDAGTTATETITATTANISGSLTWTSSNTSVATVSASGNTATITMKAGGTAIITAKNGSTSASCTVVITENELVAYKLSGTWTFNETLTQTGWASGDTSKYELIDFTLIVDDNVLDRNVFEYGVRDMYGCVYFSMHFNGAESGHVYSQYHWSSRSYGGCSITTQAGWHSYFADGCIVNFGTEPQTVSEEFYNWFTANAIESPYSTCCFDTGTKVLMADGTLKNIEEVHIGDMVMSLNEDTGEYIPQRVTSTIIKHNSDDLVYVNLSNGERIGMRAYHPLLTTEGWKSLRPTLAETIMEAGKVELLEVGDILIGYEENVKIVSIETRADIPNYNTYNLSVEGYHNYIVNGVVAHNYEPCEGVIPEL